MTAGVRVLSRIQLPPDLLARFRPDNDDEAAPDVVHKLFAKLARRGKGAPLVVEAPAAYLQQAGVEKFSSIGFDTVFHVIAGNLPDRLDRQRTLG